MQFNKNFLFHFFISQQIKRKYKITKFGNDHNSKKSFNAKFYQYFESSILRHWSYTGNVLLCCNFGSKGFLNG